MEQHITASRIANSIMQEGIFGGAYVLVEGAKDIKLYGKLLEKSSYRIRQTHGKYLQREVYKILSERGFDPKFCVRDADFLRAPGNLKYVPDYAESFFVTDGHDSEIMMICSEALDNLLTVTSTQEKINTFEKKIDKGIRALIFELAKPIGYLRYANKKHNLGLSFKPEKPDGNRIKFKKFICEKNFRLFSIEDMINTVYEYSKNRKQVVSSREAILEKFNETSEIKIPPKELINGHDATEILSMIITKGLQSNSGLIQDQNSVESSLALAYELRHFETSNLYTAIKAWSESNEFLIQNRKTNS